LEEDIKMSKLPDFMAGFDSDEDFGFTTVDHVGEWKKIEKLVEEVKETEKTKMEKLEQLMLPFLVRLYKSEEDYIHWPNPSRKKALEFQIKEIMAITRGE
jgi:hypothetical protein